MDIKQKINAYVLRLKKAALEETLRQLEDWILKTELQETGLLLTKKELQRKTQETFWEFKNEGLINEWNWFNQTVRSWIYN